jgi:hypothetical protein
VYEVAKEHQPAIVFWDEVDKLFPKDGDNNDTYGQRSVAALQTAMNGFHSGGDVLTIGATNYPSKIAPAVQSRLALKFFCGMPDASGCSQIAQRCFLSQGTRPIPCEDGIDWDDIGRRLKGLSGRDIDRVVVPRARSIVQRAMKEATYFHRVGSDWIPCDEATAGARRKDQLDKKLMRPRAIRNADINLAIQQTPISPVDMTPFQELMPAAAAAAPASTSEDNAVPAAVQTAGAAVQTADAAVQTADATASVPIRDKRVICTENLTRMLLMDQDFELIDESATHPLELIRRDKWVFMRYLQDITALVLYKHEVKMTTEAMNKLHEAAEEYVRDYLANGVSDDVYKQLCAEFDDFNTQEEENEENQQRRPDGPREADDESSDASLATGTAAAAAAGGTKRPAVAAATGGTKRPAASAAAGGTKRPAPAAAAAAAAKRPKKITEPPLPIKPRGGYTVEELNNLSVQQLVAQVCASHCPANPDYGWKEEGPSPHRGRGGGQGKDEAERKAYWVQWLTDPEFMTYRERRQRVKQ